MKREIKQALKNTMTVGQLKKLLDKYCDDTPVFFSCDYGDYNHTQQALPITDDIELTTHELRPSAYSRSKVSIEQEPDVYIDKSDFDTHEEWVQAMAEQEEHVEETCGEQTDILILS